MLLVGIELRPQQQKFYFKVPQTLVDHQIIVLQVQN